ncbi:hypothetical protein BT69DRAFT_1347368 [Atractiella rhizophila]|nr:hypothetical protein BT69DRAFT_1347368 [Atractiella rhizophila]
MADSIDSDHHTRVPTPELSLSERPLSSGDAKAELAALQEDLRQQTTRKSTQLEDGGTPAFEGGEDDEDEFNLLEFLKGDKERRDAVLEEVKRERAKKMKTGDLELGVDGGGDEKFIGSGARKLGVVWQNLTVKGAGGIKINIRTFPNAIIEFFLSPVLPLIMRLPKFAPKTKTLIHNFNGYLRPGEMCLVLGRPGSGCTTFLKNISNQRVGYLSVEGDVTYGGLAAENFGRHGRYEGEVVYCPEDEIHLPTLTVQQTLEFALKNKTPPHQLRLADEKSRAAFRTKVVEYLLKMLGIPHTKNTLVGNEFVRGVSGGERKRVSIAEMMITRAIVMSWDNSTRGLDASTALDYAKSLRVMTDVFEGTTFVSLYQAGEGIYEQFDKVLVIDDGRCAFYGPAAEARAYFVSLGFADLPRQTTADYLTGCTDPNERRFQDGKDASSVPSTPEQLEEAFLKSSYNRELMEDMREYKEEVDRALPQFEKELRFLHKVEKQPLVLSGKSPYQVSFLDQIWALTVRQFRLRIQDTLGLSVAYITSVIAAIITGSVYLNLPETSAGAFTRGGVLFLALLLNAFNAFNELPTQMMGRPILWKHRGFAFYRPAALSIASTLADIPINFFQILSFSLILYWMTGLKATAGAFFTFLALVFMGFLALASFFRLLGACCISYDVAARFAAALVSAMVLYSGYLIPVFSMKRWLFWLYYANPVNWGFQGLMSNEFGGLELLCVGSNIIPRNVPGVVDSYPNDLGPNQVCTLAGARPAQPFVRGGDYISAAFQYQTGVAWRNFGFLVAYFILFLTLQCLAATYLRLGQGMPAIQVYKKENKELKELNERLQANKADFRSGKRTQDLSALTTKRVPFTWEKLVYDVPVAGGKKRLLNEVYGYVKPGTLTALMGASGAGKTTLLDVLSDRKTIGVIGGDILVNGRKFGKDFQRGTAYVEQLDTHQYTSTVREAFRFSAYLRQPAHVSKEEKDAYCEEIIQLLEMEDLADSMIGFPGFGLGVEARKRLTIGVELAAKPQLLLFLDEPTSGLDGQSAYNIVRFLRKLAAAGQSILCTIHQPNALLFEHFDRLLLLKGGGNCVYFGPIGKDSQILRDYFAKNGAKCPPNANPAEFMLDAIGAGSQKRIGNKDWGDRWRDTEEFQQVKREIEDIKKAASAAPDVSDEKILEYAAPWSTQFKVVIERTNRSLWRSPDYVFTRLFAHVVIALLTGLTFLNVPANYVGLQYRVFALFIVTVMPAIIISQIEPTFIMARQVFIREASSKMYSPTVFSISQLIAELPYSLLCGVAFFIFLYYPTGFDTSSDRAGYAFLLIMIIELWAVTIGQAIAALSPSIFIAAMVNPFLLIITSLFAGVTIPYPQMPKFWRSWLYHVDPLTYLIGGLVSNELHGLEITCNESELFVFDLQLAKLAINGLGHLVGDEFYTPLQISFGDRYRNFGFLVVYTLFNAVVTVVASTFLRYAKR